MLGISPESGASRRVVNGQVTPAALRWLAIDSSAALAALAAAVVNCGTQTPKHDGGWRRALATGLRPKGDVVAQGFGLRGRLSAEASGSRIELGLFAVSS
jgi:hypothetical protein